MPSVVIPAHNEAGTIAATLEALFDGVPDGYLHPVVVVVNGSSDETAARARAARPDVTVVEIDVASKTTALEEGDRLAGPHYPRLYLDADVRLDRGAAAVLGAAVTTGGLLAAAPRPRYDIAGCGRMVRSYYRFVAALQADSRAIAGTGAMMVAEAGRRRFGEWPDVIADDYFLDGQFADDERRRIPDAGVMVGFPRGLRSCVRRRARVHQGNRDVYRSGLRRFGRRAYRPSVREVLTRHPRLVLDLPAHVGITLAARVVAAWGRRRGAAAVFYRDHTSRPAGRVTP